MTLPPAPVVLPWTVGAQPAATMSRLRIVRWDTRRDGPATGAALRRKLQVLYRAGAERVYPAGAVVRALSEARPTLQAVVRGLMKVTIDGERALLGPGDVAFLPAGAIRHVEVVGDAAVHCLEAIDEAA